MKLAEDLHQRRWKTFNQYAHDRLQMGWWGIPGGSSSRSTKTHLVWADSGTPICGAKMGANQEFQWCASGNAIGEVECTNCRRDQARLKSAFEESK